MPVGRRTSRAPLPPWLWPSSGPLRRGAYTRPEPLRRSAAHVSAMSAGVAASDGGPRPHRRLRRQPSS